MSTDDLTRRARAWATQPLLHEHYGAALVSELADEVDRLRGINERLIQTSLIQERRLEAEVDRLRGERDAAVRRHELAVEDRDDARTERDAARAALERVTDLLTLWARLASQQANLGDVVHDLTRALEGES